MWEMLEFGGKRNSVFTWWTSLSLALSVCIFYTLIFPSLIKSTCGPDASVILPRYRWPQSPRLSPVPATSAAPLPKAKGGSLLCISASGYLSVFCLTSAVGRRQAGALIIPVVFSAGQEPDSAPTGRPLDGHSDYCPGSSYLLHIS